VASGHSLAIVVAILQQGKHSSGKAEAKYFDVTSLVIAVGISTEIESLRPWP